MNECYDVELRDRIYLCQNFIEDYLLGHRLTDELPEVQQALQAAQEYLNKAYQAIPMEGEK